ncbi:MAG: substrate-binding domain-containing protein, partial [Clostridiaceae bacterium]|nr:substrate-binding domain-containing protein [Clostridiaceae bacterium]
MKISKKLALVLCTMVTLSSLAGCGSKSDSETPSSKTKKIAVIVKSTDAPYWQTVKKGAEDEAEKSKIEMYFTGAAGGETDINGQVNLVETAINQQVDGIVLAPSDSTALAPVVDKAIEAGIPVVIIDSGIDTDKYISYATTNNEDAAYKVGKELGKLTNGKGTVAILGFQPGAGSNIAREDGFKRAIAEFP